MADVKSAAAPQSGLPSSALENWGDIDKGLPLFEAFKVPGQQDTAKFGLSWSSSFPLGLKANKTLTLTESIEAVQRFTWSGDLIKLIGQHGGAALIRGLPIKPPDDYSKVAHAFGFRPHVEVGRPPLRTLLAPNVKTANEG